jgi:hypothetical protein
MVMATDRTANILPDGMNPEFQLQLQFLNGQMLQKPFIFMEKLHICHPTRKTAVGSEDMIICTLTTGRKMETGPMSPTTTK